MAVKGVTISDLNQIASPVVQLPGGLFEVEVLAGPVANAYVTRRLTTEQLAAYLGTGAGPNASKSLLKEFRFFRKADRDADASGGACFETDLDWRTCCAFTVVKIEFYRASAAESFRYQELVCVYDPAPIDPTHLAYVDASFTGLRNPCKFVPAADPLRLSYTNAPAFVCRRADGSEKFDATTITEATDWTNGGGPGSLTFLNRPAELTNFVTLAAGTILDVQGWPVDLSDWPLRAGPGAEIRNNRLLYNGRIAPFSPDADASKNFFTVFGGKVAARINFQSSEQATVILSDVQMVDFGQSQFPTLTGGPATTGEPGGKVVLRNGSAFDIGYQPHPATTIIVESTGVEVGTGRAVKFDKERHWPLITNGTYTLDATGAQVDVCFQLILAVGATEINVPAGFKLTGGGQFDATLENTYSFCVRVDGIIQYCITQ